MKDLANELAARLKGDVVTDAKTRATYSRDTSVFERTPEIVVFPKDADDVAVLVQTVAKARSEGHTASLAPRSAGTCMTGGPLSDSVVAVFTKYMNTIEEVGDGYAIAEPGVFYRNFEKATRKVANQLLPSFPASRELCALGGIVGNNAGGERTLEYGKTEDYVLELDVVLADGTQTTFKALSPQELAEKKTLSNLEGTIYRDLDELLTNNAAAITAAKPKVSKNSAGYALWNIKNKERDTFDLAQLVTGSQGTLALTTKMKLRLVREQGYRSMLVVFLNDLEHLPEVVRRVLPFTPESFESYDDHTFGLAIRFLPHMLSSLGFLGALRLAFSFLPELGMVATGGVPRLVLMAEFSEDTHEEALGKARAAEVALEDLSVRTSIKKSERRAQKYWIVRRESFSLLRKSSKGLTAAPFIDDLVVPPESYAEFLPKLRALLDEYADRFVYTIAGHIGNGNFHIIPLMNLAKPEVRNVILELTPRVYELVLAHGGSLTGEHNDGIIRTPYLPMQFGDKIVQLFAETKRIFDPQNILNPGKKVGGTFADIERDMVRHG